MKNGYELLKRSGMRIPLVFSMLVVGFSILGIKEAIESSIILFVFVTAFQSVIPFIVAYISGSSYVKSGLLQLLLLSCAMVALGIGSLIVAWGLLFVNGQEWANFAVTMHDVGLFAFAVFSLSGSLVAIFKRTTHERNKVEEMLDIAFAYFVVGVLMVFLGLSTWFGISPRFVIQGEYSLLRNSVLGTTIALLVISSVLFGKIYFESKSSVVYWYTLGLALYAIGIIALLTEPDLGTPLSWTGRAAQYAGSVFFLIAILGEFSRNKTVNGWMEAFKRDKLQFDFLFANMMEGFAYHKMIFGENGKPVDYVFIEVNDAFGRLTGLGKEVLGKKATEVLPGIDRDPADWISIYGKVARTGESVKFENYSQSLQRWYWVSAYCPEKGYFATIFEDITERKKTEEKLELYSKDLERLVDERTKQLKDSERLAAIGQTAGMVGHDIRSPLQAIEGTLYLAKEELNSLPPQSEAKKNFEELLAEIEDKTRYINRIVSDLQDYSRPIKPQLERTDLPKLIREALMTTNVPESISVNILISEDFPNVTLDPVLMKRVLINLVTNAVQAMPNGGKLAVCAYQEADDIVITVEDTGMGIPEVVKPKLFQPLFTTKSEGTGFGLAVCKRLVEALDGSIDFESEVGKGTKFTIRLSSTRK